MNVLFGDVEIQLPPDEYDPHVRVVGAPEAVRMASSMVRQELDPPNKVTMKMDVPWNHHSHIIGKGGNTIQPVVKKTGVSIHFPDGNKSNEVKKSNQVSINSRGEQLQGLEEARQAIRSLTPLIFTFTLSSSVQFVSVVDPTTLIVHVQNTYNVQVELRATEEMTLVGCVRGSEAEAKKVKEATQCILQTYCATLASQVPIQMAVEVAPQHQSFVLGRNNDNIKRIMHRTSTKISFPDWSDPTLSPLKKSTVTISGALENVYLARQNIIGSLPLVLMFDLAPGMVLEMFEVAQMMQVLDVQIVLKSCRVDGRRPVVVKSAERNAENVYEAWRTLCRVEASGLKANIPQSYHIPASNTLHHQPSSDLALGHWAGGGGSGSSSPLPSSSPTSAPLLFPPPTSLWGGLSSSSTPPPLLPHLTHSLHHDLASPTSSLYPGTYVRNGHHTYNNSNSSSKNINNNSSSYINGGPIIRSENLVLPKDPNSSVSGSSGGSCSGGVILDSLVKSMKSLEVTNGELSCGTSSNSGSSLSSPSPSPRDASPDQLMYSSSTSSSFQDAATQHHTQPIDALSAMLKDLDRRAPGCEKKHMELVAAQKLSLSDYSSKKVEAAKAMKQDVGSTPRTPTSSWSGYGFSKSMPGFMIRQKHNEAKEAMQNGVTGGGGLDEWMESWQQKHDVTTNGLASFPSPSTSSSSSSTNTPSQAVSRLKYQSSLSQQFPQDDKVLSSLRPRLPVNLSASNFMDCVLPRHRERDVILPSSSVSPSSMRSSSLSSQTVDITSILTDLQLPQYIDVFLGHEVDLKMFLSLEDYELKELGITIFGHRKRILMAIKDLSCKSSLFHGTTAAAGNGNRGGMTRLNQWGLKELCTAAATNTTTTTTTPSAAWD